MNVVIELSEDARRAALLSIGTDISHLKDDIARYYMMGETKHHPEVARKLTRLAHLNEALTAMTADAADDADGPEEPDEYELGAELIDWRP